MGLTAMGVTVMGDEYATGRAAELDPWTALKCGSVLGAAEVIGELVGMPSFLKFAQRSLSGAASGRELAQLLVKHAAVEVPGEELTTTIQFLADELAPYGLTPDATLGDYLQAVADTFVVTIGQTALMGAGGAGASRLAARMNPDGPQADALRAEQADRAADAARTAAMDKWATRGLSPVPASPAANETAPTQARPRGPKRPKPWPNRLRGLPPRKFPCRARSPPRTRVG